MPVTINGTTGIAGANGSASTPAVQGEDTNTGVFFPAADTVAVATGGSERLRVDSSGRLGVGTSSPGAALEVSGETRIYPSSGAANLRFGSGGSEKAKLAVDTSSNMIFETAGSERARIDSSGNLLVGTTSGTGSQTYIRRTTAANDVLTVQNASNATGVAFIGFRYGTSGNGSEVGYISTNGTTTSYNTSSDYRLKENVQPMQDALAVIAQLNPVTYTWKADGSDGQGFIAHELQAVVPDCVTGEKDAVDAEGNPQYQGVDTSFLVATLVAALKELKAEVDSLKAQLEAN
jgi:hypothetical protein